MEILIWVWITQKSKDSAGICFKSSETKGELRVIFKSEEKKKGFGRS